MGAAPARVPPTTSTTLFAAVGSGPALTAPGSGPDALPGPVLIADEGNNRLVIVDPDGLDLAPPFSDLAPHAATMGLP